MKRIGLLSDTHGYYHPGLENIFSKCDEIWHAGDIGNPEITNKLASLKPLRAVYGNIDGKEIRKSFPLHQRFKIEEVDVWITHIGGYPGNYAPAIKADIHLNPPKLFISGHSHILKVMNDKKLGLLHMNPGAAGIYGIHKVITVLRFTIDGNRIKDLEVVELKK